MDGGGGRLCFLLPFLWLFWGELDNRRREERGGINFWVESRIAARGVSGGKRGPKNVLSKEGRGMSIEETVTSKTSFLYPKLQGSELENCSFAKKKILSLKPFFAFYCTIVQRYIRASFTVDFHMVVG